MEKSNWKVKRDCKEIYTHIHTYIHRHIHTSTRSFGIQDRNFMILLLTKLLCPAVGDLTTLCFRFLIYKM